MLLKLFPAVGLPSSFSAVFRQNSERTASMPAVLSSPNRGQPRISAVDEISRADNLPQEQ
jgi:hypothetical protein